MNIYRFGPPITKKTHKTPETFLVTTPSNLGAPAPAPPFKSVQHIVFDSNFLAGTDPSLSGNININTVIPNQHVLAPINAAAHRSCISNDTHLTWPQRLSFLLREVNVGSWMKRNGCRVDSYRTLRSSCRRQRRLPWWMALPLGVEPIKAVYRFRHGWLRSGLVVSASMLLFCGFSLTFFFW